MAHKNIYLTGFMGSGKTSVGRILAQKMGVGFSDTDSLIEKETGLTIPEIFEKFGEAFFRKKETEVLRKLAHHENQIIATGGGIILKKENRDILKNGIWVYISSSPAHLEKNLQTSTNRPLLRGETQRQKIESLFSVRQPLYNLAPIIFHTEGLSVFAIANKLVSFLNNYDQH